MIIELLAETDVTLEKSGTTNHFERDRITRNNKAIELLGEGEIVNQFYVFRGEPEKPQVHTLLSNGIIEIHDIETGKLITMLIARPGQIRRYYRKCDMIPPKVLVSTAYENYKKDLNKL